MSTCFVVAASYQPGMGGASMRQPRPAGAGANTQAGAPGSQQNVRPSSMNARPIIGQSTAQVRPGMAMTQPSMSRPAQQGAPTMPQGARPGYRPQEVRYIMNNNDWLL